MPELAPVTTAIGVEVEVLIAPRIRADTQGIP